MTAPYRITYQNVSRIKSTNGHTCKQTGTHNIIDINAINGIIAKCVGACLRIGENGSACVRFNAKIHKARPPAHTHNSEQ